MKYKKQCPKCGSREIFVMDQDRSGGGQHQGTTDSTTYYSNVSVQQYICCKCGYSEDWVDRFSIEGVSRSRQVYQFNK